MNKPVGKPDKRAEKKKRIIDTAYSLFLQKSVNSTAVDDVVKAAGIARGTFYLYFKDKSDLLEQLIMYKSADSMKSLLAETQMRTLTENLDFEDMCRLFVGNYIDFFVIHKEILTIIQKNVSSCLKDIPDFQDITFEDIYAEILNKFIKYGYTKDKAQKVMYIIIDMIGSVCCDAVLYSKPFDIEDIRESVVACAMSIIRGLKG